MIKTSKILNIVLISQLFISSAIAMEDNTNIDNLCPELFEKIISYLVPKKLPDNKKEFKKHYKNVSNLRLVSKNLNNLVDEHINLDKLNDSLEEQLLKIINSKTGSISDKTSFAIEIGSKKFLELNEQEILKFHDIYQHIENFKKSIKNNYPEIKSLIFNKFILKNIENIEHKRIEEINEILKNLNKKDKKALNKKQFFWNIKRKTLLLSILIFNLILFLTINEFLTSTGPIIIIMIYPIILFLVISCIMLDNNYCVDSCDCLFGISLIILSVPATSYLVTKIIENDPAGFCWDKNLYIKNK